jgi:hypothetical protein
MTTVAPPVKLSSTLTHGSTMTGTLVPVAPPSRAWLEDCIRKPNVYSDGTIWYAYFATSLGEPYSVQEALASPSWKVVMVDEYNALIPCERINLSS